MEYKDGNYLLARHLFSRPEVARHPESGDLLIQLIHNRRAEGDILNSVLNQPEWVQHPRAREFIDELEKVGTVNEPLRRLVAENPRWEIQSCSYSLSGAH
jgi:hypothetical protein